MQTFAHPGDKAFDFTALLHTYFRCDDVTKVVVEGLKGAGKKDKVNGMKLWDFPLPLLRPSLIVAAYILMSLMTC